MGKTNKPILNCAKQISHLQSKGVKFEIISTADAEKYLNENNNYFKLRAYRKNFPKHPDGADKDKYINLDFAMLKDLAIIDMHLRYKLMHLVLDIEHFAKVKLLRTIGDSRNDGYEIVESYFCKLKSKESETSHPYQKLEAELERNRKNPYCGGIIESFKTEMPVWAFVEVITFGEFIHFYKHCADVLDIKDMKNDYYLFMSIKELRNAAAHNNCIINELYDKNAREVSYELLNALGKNGVTKTERGSKLSNERVRQIVTTLYTHKKIVLSDGVRENQKLGLNSVAERMFRNITYYDSNPKIKTFFEFFKKTVDIFQDLSYHVNTLKKGNLLRSEIAFVISLYFYIKSSLDPTT